VRSKFWRTSWCKRMEVLGLPPYGPVVVQYTDAAR
jgi:hypothetical protein